MNKYADISAAWKAWAALVLAGVCACALCLGVWDAPAFADEAEDEAALSEEEQEQQRKFEEAQAAYDAAYEEAAAAAGMLGGLPALQAQLSTYPEQLADAELMVNEADAIRASLEDQRDAYVAERTGLQEKREVADAQRAEALYGLILADQALALADGPGLVDVIVGDSSATIAESHRYMIEKVAATKAAEKQAAEDRMADLDAKIEAVNKKIADTEDAIEAASISREEAWADLVAVVEGGSEQALAIEKLASESRQGTKLAIEAVEALDGEVEGVNDLKAAAQEWDVRGNGTRIEALVQAGAWYDTVDALVGLDGSITYGTGIDYALSEAEFVAKWAPAIDAFFTSQGAPLAGHGTEMALCAYNYRIDPRLCAAVSIVESSGGRYCIRPHNAWGWGAADSDPYNLAFEWRGWAEAIEGWHRGMAFSQSGLATTPSLTAMGDIYCSSPIWGYKVATLMEQISSFVDYDTGEVALGNTVRAPEYAENVLAAYYVPDDEEDDADDAEGEEAEEGAEVVEEEYPEGGFMILEIETDAA